MIDKEKDMSFIITVESQLFQIFFLCIAGERASLWCFYVNRDRLSQALVSRIRIIPSCNFILHTKHIKILRD